MNRPLADESLWRAVLTTPLPCFEWLAFTAAALPAVIDRRADGVVVRLDATGALALHPAPGRWVLAGAQESLLDSLRALAHEGDGVLTEVSGKWCRFAFTGQPGAGADGHPLASGVALGEVLEGRACAALWLFDCPAMIVTIDGDFEAWVEASYAPAFAAVLADLGVRVEAA